MSSHFLRLLWPKFLRGRSKLTKFRPRSFVAQSLRIFISFVLSWIFASVTLTHHFWSMSVAVPLLWKSHSTERALKRFVTWVLPHVVNHIWHLVELAFANLALELLVLPASLLVDHLLGPPELFCFLSGLSVCILVIQLHSIERAHRLLLLRHLNCNLIIAKIIVPLEIWIYVLHRHHLCDLLLDWGLLVVFHHHGILILRFAERLLICLDKTQRCLRWNSCWLVLRWL